MLELLDAKQTLQPRCHTTVGLLVLSGAPETRPVHLREKDGGFALVGLGKPSGGKDRCGATQGNQAVEPPAQTLQGAAIFQGWTRPVT